MRNRVYSGTYSLEHWMNLLRTGNIILPKYQRHFVWEKERVDKLVQSIKDELFIPPVTIGSFKKDGKIQNLILDGQQRLTSILLAYLGIYPDKEHYQRIDEVTLATETEGTEEESDDEEPMVIKWNVNELLDKDNNYDAIMERVRRNGHYHSFQRTIDDEILKNHFLGFNYLVPETKNPIEMQRYFSSVFRSVNYSGMNLLPQESRKALYYLDSHYEQYFAPDFCERITVANRKVKGKVIMDFTRALALITAYHHTNDYHKVGKGYGRRLEVYYEHFIQNVVSGDYEDTFGKITDVFADGKYSSVMEKLKNQINNLGFFRHFESIIYVDVFLMGLIYYVVFKKEEIDVTRKNDLTAVLTAKAEDFKRNDKHSKSPASLKYLQARMEESIKIYEDYVQKHDL